MRLLFFLFAAAAIAESPLPHFLQTYCIDCHGPEKQKGDRSFHDLDLANSAALGEVLDQLQLGEMPPEKKGVKRPSLSESRAIIDWLTVTLAKRDAESANPRTVLRRLNRREYRNTMQDLLGLRMLTVDPTREFPEDERDHGFTNIGAALNLSDEHLDHYLRAADTYLTMAMHLGPISEPEVIDIKAAAWGVPAREDKTPWMYRLRTPQNQIDIGCGMLPLTNHIGLASYPLNFARSGGIQQRGYYRIAVRAEAINRLTHGYGSGMIPADLSQPMRMGLYVALQREGLTAGGENARVRVAAWDLVDHEARDYDVTVWLEPGAIPFLNWENGPGPSDWWMRDVCETHHTDIEFRGKQGSHAWHIIGKDAVPGRIISDVWRGPRMRVHSFSFTGPLPETYNSRFQRAVLGGQHDLKEVDTEKALQRFASLAFRRQVSAAEIANYAKMPFHSACKAILVSPDFLFRKESEQLSERELASRLSYFLWSSMPDPELAAAKLRDNAVRRAEAERLLGRWLEVDALVDGLTESWLRLDKLGSMPPDKRKFFDYYRWDLESAMRTETEWFIKRAITNNHAISDFLNANYSYLNANLANHYGIEGVKGGDFRRVELPAERGGLLGHASILTLTANGVDTSPIVRGIWILENILGTPPPPPPPDVEPLDPDTRGATSLRQRLDKHRKVEACADCHSKIDPLGFPLEHYDPIGGYRARYHRFRAWNRVKQTTHVREGAKVDGRGHLTSGKTVRSLTELNAALLSREQQFSRALTETLMTYATGRRMTYRDRAEIARIAALKPAGEFGFRDLILEVVASDIFVTR